jgi:protocatechuate 3,4-dioxygenase beta subunit
MGMKRLPALIFSLALALYAQSGGQTSVSGQVLNAATGEPVRKAAVILSGTSQSGTSRPSRFSTTTDAAGRFTMTNLDAGTYHLSAEHAGFVSGEYGAHAPGWPGAALTLAAGQTMQDVAIRLTPQAVISGRVLDEDGDPVRGVVVRVARFSYTTGHRQVMPVGGSNTNDLGEYRIPDLSPGKYYVSAMPPQSRLQNTEDRSAVRRAEEDYVATYYPGARDIAGAVQVTAAAGAQLRNIDISLARCHTVNVSGRVVNGSPARMQAFSISLVSTNSFGMNGGSPVNAEGEFEIRHVMPGSYTLAAHGNEGMKSYSARRPLEVGGANVEDVILTVAPGVAVTGRARVDGEAALPFANVQINLMPFQTGSPVFGPLPNRKLNADGTFELQNVNPDHYALNISGLLNGFYVKSIRSGNLDVLANGIEIGGAPPAPLDIVLSPNAAEIAGAVQDAGTQQPTAGATVVLIPQEKERRGRTNLYRTANSDAGGHFTFRGLTPGEYKVFAWDEVEHGAWFDPDFMAPLEGKGAAVTIAEGGRESVQLTSIPGN